jgi:hypothetical protein
MSQSVDENAPARLRSADVRRLVEVQVASRYPPALASPGEEEVSPNTVARLEHGKVLYPRTVDTGRCKPA